jgi:TonB family protein
MRIAATVSGAVIVSALALGACNAPPAETNAVKSPVDATAAAGRDDAIEKKATPPRKSKPAASRANAARPTAVRVAETVTPPTKIRNVQPVYPALARAARVEGSVLLEVEVDANGKVSDAKVIRSVPLLDDAALAAVRQWEYTPMRRGNVAVPTVMTVTVNFTRS